jgi:hypothetical protein
LLFWKTAGSGVFQKRGGKLVLFPGLFSGGGILLIAVGLALILLLLLHGTGGVFGLRLPGRVVGDLLLLDDLFALCPSRLRLLRYRVHVRTSCHF